MRLHNILSRKNVLMFSSLTKTQCFQHSQYNAITALVVKNSTSSRFDQCNIHIFLLKVICRFLLIKLQKLASKLPDQLTWRQLVDQHIVD